MNLKKQIATLQVWQKEGLPKKPFQPDEMGDTSCMNCGTLYKGNFCPNCGQPAKIKRLTFWSVVNESLMAVANLDSRIMRTSLELLLRPGHMIREYVMEGKRQPYMKPISLLFLLSAGYIFEQHVLFPDANAVNMSLDVDSLSEMSAEDATLVKQTMEIAKRIVTLWVDNKALSTLLGLLLYLIPFKRTYRKTTLGSTMNYMEYFYLLCFLGCQGLIVSILCLPFEYMSGNDVLTLKLADSSLLLYTWVCHQLFNIGWGRSLKLYIKMLILYVLAVAVFAVICAAIGCGGYYLYQFIH